MRWRRARHRGISTNVLLLAGVTLNAFFSALILFVQYLADFAETYPHAALADGRPRRRQLRAARRRAAARRSWRSPCSRWLPRALEPAQPRRRQRRERAASTSCGAQRLAFFSASLATGAAVSLGGPIGFIGIVVPHLVRLMVGADHRLVLPASALFGAAFSSAATSIARTVMAPVELPVGIVTALIGGPFFLWLLVRAKR